MQFPYMGAEINVELGRRLKALRDSFRESQTKFGERFGVQQGTVSRWENGHIPERTLWARIAKVARQPEAVFFHDFEPPKSSASNSIDEDLLRDALLALCLLLDPQAPREVVDDLIETVIKIGKGQSPSVSGLSNQAVSFALFSQVQQEHRQKVAKRKSHPRPS